MDPDGRKVDIEHGEPCRCWIDEGGAIYIGPECKRIGHHVTKRRISQLLYSMRKKRAK